MKFNFTSQTCTTKEQSERLLALGLKNETADMKYPCTTEYYGGFLTEGLSSLPMIINTEDDEVTEYDLPAWSLHRLKCLLPDKTHYGDGYLTVEIINENVYIVLVIEDVEQRVIKYTKGNLYDNLISCINFFVKESLFNKEYLEG